MACSRMCRLYQGLLRISGANLMRVVIGTFAVAFVVLSVARVHGFSLGEWRTAIDGSPHEEVILGCTREIRSDDYVAVLPHILAQRIHDPPFPQYNSNIGDGKCNMLINYAIPVRHVITLFRPQLWGYFISDDIGLAFNWWFYVFGIWIVLYGIAVAVLNVRRSVAALTATAFLFSPFCQYFSLNCAPSLIFAGSILLSFKALHAAASRSARLAYAATLFMSMTAFMLTFSFMPYLVVLSHFILLIGIGMVAQSKASNRSKLADSCLWGVIGVLCLTVVALIMIDNWETVQMVRQSSYPGGRVSLGGAGRAEMLMRCHFQLFQNVDRWGGRGSLGGSTTFYLFSPLVLCAACFDMARRRKKPTWVEVALVSYCLLMVIWCLVGLPEPFARATLLTRVPARRAIIGIGISDALLVAVFVSQGRQESVRRALSSASTWLLLLLWTGLVCFLGIRLRKILPEYGVAEILTGTLVSSALGLLLLIRSRVALVGIAAISIVATSGFNPVARGGSRFIHDNPLSKEIQRIDRLSCERGRSTVWIAYGDQRYDIKISNLFRMLGVRSINGVHSYAQRGIWAVLDPDGENAEKWNRYSHVRFRCPNQELKSHVPMHLLQHDLLLVELHPSHPAFMNLGVTHVVHKGSPGSRFDAVANLRYIFSYADNHIYEVISRPLPDTPQQYAEKQ